MRALNLGRQGNLEISRYCHKLKILPSLIRANVNKMSIKKNCLNFIQALKIMAPISYFKRVKIISLIETDVSEVKVATQLGFPKS
jgi:hypothetical protein